MFRISSTVFNYINNGLTTVLLFSLLWSSQTGDNKLNADCIFVCIFAEVEIQLTIYNLEIICTFFIAYKDGITKLGVEKEGLGNVLRVVSIKIGLTKGKVLWRNRMLV